MITNEECLPLLDSFSIVVPEPSLTGFVSIANSYDLSKYPPEVATPLAIYVVCYLGLASGTRELISRGADGASQSFKNKDTLKMLKNFIKKLDKDGVIDDLFVAEESRVIWGLKGYV